MHRRFAVVTASLAGAFAAIVALPLVSACQRRASDTSFLAADAQAAAANPTTTADTVKQVGPMPSLRWSSRHFVDSSWPRNDSAPPGATSAMCVAAFGRSSSPDCSTLRTTPR